MNATADTTAPDGDKTVQNANDDALKQGAKKKNLKPGMEILREADHECSHETIEKFYSKVSQIMETMKKKSDDKKQPSASHSKNQHESVSAPLSIQDDPHSNVIQVLRKIEDQLNFFCEARNFLNATYDREKEMAKKGGDKMEMTMNIDGKTIIDYENEIQQTKKLARQL